MKKKLEFGQFILKLYAFACIAWIEQDYILAFLNNSAVNTEVTTTIIVSLAVTILGYYANGFGLKNSLNKHNRTKAEVEQEQQDFKLK